MRAAVRVLLGICIVVFCGLVVSAATALLATAQLRLSAGIGPTYDTWRRNLQANENARDQLDKKLTSAQDRAKQDGDQLNYVKTCLGFFNSDGSFDHTRIDAQTANEYAAAKRARTQPGDAEGDVRCLLSGRFRLQLEAKSLQAQALVDNAEIQGITKQQIDNNNLLLNLNKDHSNFLAFKDMENIWYLKPFLQAPYDFLVLLLVMLMGGSGGVIRLFRDYGDQNYPNPGDGDYFVVPLVGAVVAMCGYVLAKTGVLAMSSAREDTSLSPFMISFVGIVSGLLAREVIDCIAAQGRKLLQGQGAQATGRAGGARVPAAAPGGATQLPGTQPAPGHAG